MRKYGFIIAIVAVSFLFGCGNKNSSSENVSEDVSEEKVTDVHPNASLIDSIKAVTQNFGIWTTDLNEGSGMINPPQSSQTTELLYDTSNEKFYLRELWVYENKVMSDTIYTCKIKKTVMGFMLLGIGNECTYEVRSSEWIEGIWPDTDYRIQGQGSIKYDVVKALIKE